MDSLIQKIGEAVKKVARRRGSEWWYTPRMAAASRAIAERIPLVDIVLEVRDARIPLSSECLLIRKFKPSSRRIILLNKMDLASRSRTKEWLRFYEEQKITAFAVNSHNHGNIRKLLNFLQARIRELKQKDDDPCRVITLLLVGITNVGKSALANSLHQVGRISAAEKGKLTHSVVSSQPGETQSIKSLKIASHPNVYVLDTPGALPPNLSSDDETCSKLALTGALKDTVVGELELARYFLSIMNASDEHQKWGKLCDDINTEQFSRDDHTQDVIVKDVRRALYGVVSSFRDASVMVEEELKVLHKAFGVSMEPETCHDSYSVVATKLLNLFRTGRLGHYTLDSLPYFMTDTK